MAYGARLESVLGESPQGFESPILRPSHESPMDPGPVGLSSHPGPGAGSPAHRRTPPSRAGQLYPGPLRVSPIEPLHRRAAPT